MDFDFAEFLQGINDHLSKNAEEGSIFGMTGGAIFPTISSQAKWQFSRTNTHLQFHDGNNVYNFHLPDGEHEHDFPAVKQEHEAPHEFGKDAVSRGTAQIHRADPGHIYFTLQDGRSNPTYTLKHVNGDQWRAIPKHKTVSNPLDKEAFIKGALEKLAEGGLLDAIAKGVDGMGRGAIRGGMALGHDPLLSAGAGLGLGAAYDVGRRGFYNTDEENAEESGMKRLARYLAPAAAMGITGAVAKGTFPNYYNEFPLHRP